MSEVVLVDTSVAVPLLVADHENHRTFSERSAGSRLGLSGHAAFETFSVMTRLPPPHRRSPTTVHRIMAFNFPASVFLSAQRSRLVFEKLAQGKLAGGSVYDALVGAAAAEAKLLLLSADSRAADIYAYLDVRVEFLS